MPTCKLCMSEVEKLIDSHLIPRAAYKKIAPEGTTRVEVNPTDAFINTKQESKFLLCSACEDRFSKHGETPMGLLWASGQGFPLLSKILATTPAEPGCYYGNCLSNEDQYALIYFAVSILWRASVWPENVNDYKGALGMHYEEEFRKFLLSESILKKVKFIIQVNANPDTNLKATSNTLVSFPAITREGNSRVHEFNILGIKYYVHVGQSAQEINDYYPSDTNILIFTENFSDVQWHKDLIKKIKNEITPRGKLAKQMKFTSSA